MKVGVRQKRSLRGGGSRGISSLMNLCLFHKQIKME